jgi:hypothetical protein
MNFNENKYYIANDNRLTELEKLQLAKDLLELERQGVLEYCDGRWGSRPASRSQRHPTGPWPASAIKKKEETDGDGR